MPTMFFLGAVFAGLWWASVHYGRKIDEDEGALGRGAGRRGLGSA